MATILGIDAAWTATQPTGVALVASDESRGRCIAVAPSYDAFIELATSGTPVDWNRPSFAGSAPDIPRLLDAAQRLAGGPVDLVTVDMPVAAVPVTGRREADNAVSRQFGGRGCGTHTPNTTRPGPLGAALSAAFAQAGFPIATAATPPGQTHQLVEVYPHPALLELLDRAYRVPYKVAKARRYWASVQPPDRIAKLLVEFCAIRDALVAWFGPFDLPLPAANSVRSPASLKRYEDALDALVCAWVGVCYVQQHITALGDGTAAIWCPQGALAAHVERTSQFPPDRLAAQTDPATRG